MSIWHIIFYVGCAGLGVALGPISEVRFWVGLIFECAVILGAMNLRRLK